MEDKGKGPMQDIPPVDWRNQGVLNGVREQKDCDCCWAIVATEAIETQYNIKNEPEELLQLSPQELINCVEPDPDDQSCYLGTINEGFRYAIETGIRKEEDCVFVAKRQPCIGKTKDMPIVKIESYIKIKDGEDQLIEAVKKHPVGAVIKITKKLETYKEGIYEGPDPEEIIEIKMDDSKKEKNAADKHAILVTGFDTDQNTGKNFWWIMSSWGERWGINGFAKVIRSSSSGKESLINTASYPVNPKYSLYAGE